MTRAHCRLLAAALVLTVPHWGTGGTQAQSSGRQPGSGWRVKFDGSGSSPVIVDGFLYVGAADGGVYAFDPMTGDMKWRFQTGENLSPGPRLITVPPGSSAIDTVQNLLPALRGEGTRRVDMVPAVANATVFVGSGDRSFYAIDAATGKKKWSYEAGGGMASNNLSPGYPVPAAVVNDNTVYFVSEDGLHALDALTGARKWLVDTMGGRDLWKKEPTLGDGVIFLTSEAVLYAIDPESGKSKWLTHVDGTESTNATSAKGLVCFATFFGPLSKSTQTTLYAVDAADGQVKWKVAAARLFGTPTILIGGDTVYLVTDKTLMALGLETGRQLWTFSSDEISGHLSADDRHLYVVTHKSRKGTLHAFALSTGQEQWSKGVSGDSDVVLVQDGVVYAGSDPLYALDAVTGKQLWSAKGVGAAGLIYGGRIFSISETETYFGTKRVDQGYLSAIDAKTGKLAPSK